MDDKEYKEKLIAAGFTEREADERVAVSSDAKFRKTYLRLIDDAGVDGLRNSSVLEGRP